MSQQTFGEYLRELRLARVQTDQYFSVRSLAAEIKVASCYVSKVERGDAGPPSEKTIKRLADALGENPIRLLAKAGKIPTELKEIVLKRPLLMAELLQKLAPLSDEHIRKILAGLPEAEPERPKAPIPFEPAQALQRVAEEPVPYDRPKP